MKLSRRGFLKGVGASAIGGLLLSRPEALAHPLLSQAQKQAIEARPSREAAQKQGPEYVLWQGRLYYVTDWQRTIRRMHSNPGEELRLGATLVG